MNSEQFQEFLKLQQTQQQQINELIQILAKQQISNISTSQPTSSAGVSDSQQNVSNMLKHFTCDKFNPETTSVENFIDYFEAKCKIHGSQYTNKQKDLFITCLSPETFHEIKIAFTGTLETRTYEEIKTKLCCFYSIKKTKYKALTEFWNCTRKNGQTMEEYANKLKELCRDCGYNGDFLDRQLRDRFATGLNHNILEIDLKQKWPDLTFINYKGETEEVTFDQIFAVAQSREMAENDDINEQTVSRIQRNLTNDRINKNNNYRTIRKLTKDHCKRCGKYERHKIDDCRAKNHTCKECDVQGHFESCCIKSGRAYLVFQRKTSNRTPHFKRNVQRIERQHDHTSNSSVTDSHVYQEESDDEEDVFNVKINNSRCKKIDVSINGYKCTMDWDPGSVYSIINTQFWKTIGTPNLKKGPKLRAYCDYKLNSKGLTNVTVEVQGEKKVLPVVVMDDAEPMLFGLQWSEMFNMTFPSSVYAIKNKSTMSLQQIIDTNAELFDGKLGEVQNYEVNIHVHPGTQPKHLPARPIKFSLRKNVEAELERLLNEGIIQKVDPNETPVEWATPTVNVVKPNGQVRICGDYRITLNPALISHTYPVPQFDHLRQCLAGGEKYSKIDLNRMSSHENDQSRSKERLQEFLFTYRNTPHNTTLKSPAQMMFGRQLTCVLDNARPNTKRMLQHKQLKANIQANDHNKIPTHATGDAVYIRTKEDKYWKPAVVTQRTHKYSYLVRTPEGVLKRRHADHMRRRVVESLPEEVIGVPTSPVIGVPTSPQFLTPAGSSPDESPVTDKPSSPVVESTSRERSTNDRNMEIIADATPTPIPPRRSTRTIRPPRRLIDELG